MEGWIVDPFLRASNNSAVSPSKSKCNICGLHDKDSVGVTVLFPLCSVHTMI